MTLTTTAQLADLVVADARRARVLERFGLDYCCGGQQSLAEASSAAGVDVEEVLLALDLPPVETPAPAGPRDRAALAHEIVDVHHAYMWEEMPRLQALVEKVHRVHGDNHPELATVEELFVRAVTELDPHMTKEERSIFPAISRMERTGTRGGAPLADQIAVLVEEHTVVGDLFKQIGSVTEGYAVPADACGSYRAMLEGLREMELDLHEHIHKENNVLFPGALELERSVGEG